MTYFEDMGTLTIAAAGPQIRAVGYLDPHYEFPQGDVPPAFLRKLEGFAQEWFASARVLGLLRFLGSHTCEFCREASGTGDFAVPAGDILFVAPVLVDHYVRRHRYLPPAPFVTAVIQAPLPNSFWYGLQVRRFVPLQWSEEDEEHVGVRIKEWLARYLEAAGRE